MDSETRDLYSEILEAAKELFVRHGYHGLSMRQIAETVGVSKAALYYHFTDKEEIFLAILIAYLEEIEHLIDDIQSKADGFRDRISLFIRAILSQPVEQRAIIRLASQEMAQLNEAARSGFNQAYHIKFIDKIHQLMQAGFLRGEIREIDPHVATWSLLGMMYPYFYPAHSAEVTPSPEVVEQLISIFLDGIVDQTHEASN